MIEHSILKYYCSNLRNISEESHIVTIDITMTVARHLVRPSGRGLIMMISNRVSGSRLLGCIVYSVVRAFTRF